MQSVNISSAKGYLSSLLKNKEKLQEIIIERTGKPIAKILKYKPQII
ncbi:MAG: type II toxin-antitoxin system Phd/YefM family antitoxin [Candidatus Megaira endosymbiont of Mesostigma viride]|jgi:antitoxin (DNA-binding transcriptional repressor) of toxin-antitoxin stability system|nr:MAG: type II toxin-antitoxin system Phd/YefM family antitoxin [Candidatus Megaira endosymbiont of Mesostigma viride]HJK88875.1 type II toxin-antitoxin system Phd/YefM family antitoxin [Candidatus Megaira endosymbiont of Mesostigma viride]